jgi:hypothetical protein
MEVWDEANEEVDNDVFGNSVFYSLNGTVVQLKGERETSIVWLHKTLYTLKEKVPKRVVSPSDATTKTREWVLCRDSEGAEKVIPVFLRAADWKRGVPKYRLRAMPGNAPDGWRRFSVAEYNEPKELKPRKKRAKKEEEPTILSVLMEIRDELREVRQCLEK